MVQLTNVVKKPLFPRFSKRLARLTQWAGPYATVLQMLLIGLIVLSLSRVGLTIWQWDRVSATGLLLEMLVQGVRADLIVLGYFVAISVLLAPFFAHKLSARLWRSFNLYWATFALFFIIFMELSSPPFIMQFDVRPNRLFIEYLSYPKEVLSTLWNGFRLALILGVGFSVLLGVTIYSVLKAASAEAKPWSSKKLLLLWPLIFVLVFLQVRSTTDHRPANPALFALSGDALVNSLIINSGWSVLTALASMRQEANSSEIYGSFPREKIFEQIKAAPWLRDLQFTSTELPTLHKQEAAIKREKPLNLVIVLEESLGAT
ncbi:MAG TPA: LTA synthase family protein, partial [Cellvibrio sp.]|nr:LTA synthase family protein [Cellvibrio sp.]